MNVLILGGAGMFGPYVARELAAAHALRITDVKPPSEDLPGEFLQLDVSDLMQLWRPRRAWTRLSICPSCAATARSPGT